MPRITRPFDAAVIADRDAETVVERELLLRMTSVLWRLRRAAAAGSEPDLERKKDIGGCLLAIGRSADFPLDRLRCYEWRQARQLVFRLETLRSPQGDNRAGQVFHSRSAVPPSMTAEANLEPVEHL